LAAGGGIAWRARHESSISASADAAGTVDAAGATLWGLAFERPEGGQLSMESLRGRPLVLNFWATWCPPCVEEMPELDRFQRAWSGRSWQVVGLAVDNAAAVRRFLAKQPVSFPIGLAGLDGSTLARTLGNAQGGLPYTVVLAADGAIRQRKAGQTNLDELNRWAQSV
jgi:thiol-disulfide isomerase/thioredoxin